MISKHNRTSIFLEGRVSHVKVNDADMIFSSLQKNVLMGSNLVSSKRCNRINSIILMEGSLKCLLDKRILQSRWHFIAVEMIAPITA